MKRTKEASYIIYRVTNNIRVHNKSRLLKKKYRYWINDSTFCMNLYDLYVFFNNL